MLRCSLAPSKPLGEGWQGPFSSKQAAELPSTKRVSPFGFEAGLLACFARFSLQASRLSLAKAGARHSHLASLDVAIQLASSSGASCHQADENRFLACFFGCEAARVACFAAASLQASRLAKAGKGPSAPSKQRSCHQPNVSLLSALKRGCLLALLASASKQAA